MLGILHNERRKVLESVKKGKWPKVDVSKWYKGECCIVVFDGKPSSELGEGIDI